MGHHLQLDLDDLKKEILTMGAMVETATEKVITAFLQRREDLAEEVLRGDDLIDRKENEIEDMCLKTLALNQPVASDLRFVVMVLKVNHELERVGDLAKNMAKQTLRLLRQAPLPFETPIEETFKAVRRMVHASLDSLVNQDAGKARAVCGEDDEVDQLYRQMFAVLQERMAEDSSVIEPSIRLLSLSRHLERIADQATNIAEDVVFMVEGEVIRHQHPELP